MTDNIELALLAAVVTVVLILAACWLVTRH